MCQILFGAGGFMEMSQWQMERVVSQPGMKTYSEGAGKKDPQWGGRQMWPWIGIQGWTLTVEEGSTDK